MAISTARARRQPNIWPGYVDALSALLILVIFVILLFTFAQFLLSRMLSTQETELAALNRQIAALTAELGLEKQTGAELRREVAELSDMVSDLTVDKYDLSARIETLGSQSEADRERMREQLLSIASLQEDIAALKAVRERLESEVGEMAAAAAQHERDMGDIRDRSLALEAQLAGEQERTRLAQKTIEQREIRVQALSALVGLQREALQKQRQLSEEAQIDVAALSQKIGALKSQLQEVSDALASAERDKRDQQSEIKDLGRRLNIELARRVTRLEQYRSEFFGRLRELVGDNPAVRIVGDRFLFQSELLFGSGSAQLGTAGKAELAKLAGTLKEVAGRIPEDIDWILRVDGHTDRVPINTPQFPSNWELSTARAVSVVRFLAGQGIPARRLTAAGFGEFHPIAKGDSPEARRRNRRIEIKLTSL